MLILVRKAQVRQDSVLSKIVEQLQSGAAQDRRFALRDGVLCKEGRVVIPTGSPFIPILLQQFHASSTGGHEGQLKTYKRLSREVTWIGVCHDVIKFIEQCQTCQKNKYSTLSPAGLLNPLPIPQQVWSDVSMDFIEGLPKSKGYNSILVVVDRLSKYSHFILLAHPYTAKDVAQSFMEEVVKLHGFPESIVSDRDKVFLSNFWTALFQSQGTCLRRSSAYHPQTDGQTEVVNRCLETYLRCFAGERPHSWAQWLHWAEYWFNTSFHSAIGMTPFKALYGRDPPTLLRFHDTPSANASVEDLLRERDNVLGELRGHIARAQQRMKKSADKHRRDIQYAPGDWVYLKVRPYRQRSLAVRRNEKLAPRFFGPFEVEEKIRPAAYRLTLPTGSTIHPVFHVSQLKKAVPPGQQPQPLPPALKANFEWFTEPKDIKAVRRVEGGTSAEVLVEWEGLFDFEATWEATDKIKAQYPHFHLEDKVAQLQGVLIHLVCH